MRKKVLLIIPFLVLAAHCYSQEYEVLFAKQASANGSIHLIDKLGKTSLITKSSRKDATPVMSPNGKYIVFTSERVGWWKIWLMNLKENTFKQLTNSGNAEYFPSWSPDGKYILFISSRNGNAQVFRMNLQGGDLQNLTPDAKSYAYPSWGIDNKIYYSVRIDGTYQLAKMNPDGSAKAIITTGKGNKLMPQLSNNKKKILYYGDESGNVNIHVLHVHSKVVKQLTDHTLNDMRGRWSYDDKKIVFERGDKKNNQHVYMMNFDGSDIVKLTQSGYNYYPSFLPYR